MCRRHVQRPCPAAVGQDRGGPPRDDQAWAPLAVAAAASGLALPCRLRGGGQLQGDPHPSGDEARVPIGGPHLCPGLLGISKEGSGDAASSRCDAHSSGHRRRSLRAALARRRVGGSRGSRQEETAAGSAATGVPDEEEHTAADRSRQQPASCTSTIQMARRWPQQWRSS